MSQEKPNRILDKKAETLWRKALPIWMEAATKAGYNPFEGKIEDEIGLKGVLKLREICLYERAREHFSKYDNNLYKEMDLNPEDFPEYKSASRESIELLLSLDYPTYPEDFQ